MVGPKIKPVDPREFQVTEILCTKCGMPFTRTRSNQKRCEYCRSHGHQGSETKPKPLEFIGIDGEGMNIGERHEYVELGIGDEYRTWPEGCKNPAEIFEFLWEEYEKHPEACFVGFYLKYDWNMWLRNLPVERLERLFNPMKRWRPNTGYQPFPVQWEGWEFDILWGKRFKLRKIGSELPFMNICDAGSFFQMSLVKVLETRTKTSGITDEEVATIIEGKSRRATHTLDADMIRYNQTENRVLAKLMTEISDALTELEIPLSKAQWHGPGQAAQKWIMKQPCDQRSRYAVLNAGDELYRIFMASYYGGLFEIYAHGYIPGTTYEYDINSAYPSVIKDLPCMCGEWVEGKDDGMFTLCQAKVKGSNVIVGPMPMRTKDGNIVRPRNCYGVYWKHEIDMAIAAQLVDDVIVERQWTYYPCDHGAIYHKISDLYNTRLHVGKESSMGKVCKLIYNSVYGKFAQSIGSPKASNAVYASLITSLCRTKILEAIATHPYGFPDVMMIATDAVFFRHEHPHLQLSNKLGDWDCTEIQGLTLFKPGFYWDDRGRDILSGKVENVTIKTRGVSRKDFEKVVQKVDEQFRSWDFTENYNMEWPWVTVDVSFAQVSIKDAINRTKQEERFHELVDSTMDFKGVKQSSNPILKRRTDIVFEHDGIYRTYCYDNIGHNKISEPYAKQFGNMKQLDVFDNDGPVLQAIQDVLQFG